MADAKQLTNAILLAAVTLARDFGKRVVVIDGSLGESDLTELFECEDEVGFWNLFDGSSELVDALLETEIDRLSLIPRGELSAMLPTNLADSWQQTIESLQSAYDFVLIDSGVACDVSMRKLASLSVGTYLFVPLGGTDSSGTVDMIDELRQAGGRMMGCVVLKSES